MLTLNTDYMYSSGPVLPMDTEMGDEPEFHEFRNEFITHFTYMWEKKLVRWVGCARDVI